MGTEAGAVTAAADPVSGAAPGADLRGHRRPAARSQPHWCGWSRPRSCSPLAWLTTDVVMRLLPNLIVTPPSTSTTTEKDHHMSVRRLFAGVSTVAVLAASLSLAAPAMADPPAGYVPNNSDVIGVGSDTSEFILNYLADGDRRPDGLQRHRCVRRPQAGQLECHRACGQPRDDRPADQPHGGSSQRVGQRQEGALRRQRGRRGRLRPLVCASGRHREAGGPPGLPVRQGLPGPRHRQDQQRADQHQRPPTWCASTRRRDTTGASWAAPRASSTRRSRRAARARARSSSPS